MSGLCCDIALAALHLPEWKLRASLITGRGHN